eukprot:GGOE01048781.1.p1 GENE.GGOE01048781.1~~GGOE01048781.1.p1  ORF type:complete len:860 (-),score=223.86 GGOE01048781.1:12-2483(-)
MVSATNTLYGSTTGSIERLSESVQNSLLRNSLRLLNARITAGEIEAASQEALLSATGLITLDLHPNATDINKQVLARLRGYNFDTVKGNPLLSYVALEGSMFSDGRRGALGKVCFWIVWQAMNLDYIALQQGLPPYNRTLYLATVELSKDEQRNNMQVWYVDQLTGTPLIILSNVTYPWPAFYVTNTGRHSWGTDLYLNTHSGQVELTFAHTVSADNKMFSIGIGLNSQTLSEELRAQLNGQTTDRLFLFFRNSNGHLIAASHGKYFSLSDVDLRHVNPLVNRPNASAYVFFTCLDSTDALISEACQNLITQHHSWVHIPPSRQEMLLGGTRYWVAVGYSASSLNATVVLLKDRQSVMGSIDLSNTHVVEGVARKQRIFAAVFVATTAVAAAVPLLIGLWLGNRLRRLARGMDRIARMDFSAPSVPSTCFREVHNFQQSFLKMERGLRAFGQFVPSAVVTQLVAGKSRTDDKMETEVLTIMFANIEGFFALSASMSPAQVVEVCSEYFEVVCKHVVNCGGSIDKFIGDCIMAIWNAPLPTPHHERSAVTAALHMQAEVLRLHEAWRRRKLPALRFRLGLHTGTCLVGNFGCSTRVSYTCLGDNVNLAARLEALNKKFGTVLCASQSVYNACKDDFHFRHLSKVTVAGRSEVLSVYEVICAVDAEEVQLRSLGSFNDLSLLAGSVSLGGIQAAVAAESLGSPDHSWGSQAGYLAATDREEKGEESVSHATLLPLNSPLSSSSPGSTEPSAIPYHWGWQSRHGVLKDAAEYEAAYTALVESQYKACRVLLGARQLDAAWQRLASQLERQASCPGPWDGVFHFTEK